MQNGDNVESRSSIQNENNVESKCNVRSPFSKAVMQRVLMKYVLCM